MKKTYVKPEIEFESFALCTNIAGDCEVKITNSTRGTCTILGSGNIPLFDQQTSSICVYTDGPDLWDGACYHVPENSPNLFNS